MTKNAWAKFGLVAMTASLVVGCDTLGKQRAHRSNSLFKYLYSEETGHIDTPAIPVLSLPLRVGIAFVPSDRSKADNDNSDNPAFSENQKMALMKEISAQFKAYPFVKSIELIPTAYLSPKGGFANLDQIRTMYGVDVIALLSYDQVQFTDQGLLSLSYWTIVGVYVIRGERNDTRSMLDAAVYDIPSRKLLFRAPGIGEIKGSATPINLSEQLRKDSERGFKEAATNLVANVKVELDEFRDRVKNAPTECKIVHKPGYTGAAGFQGIEVLLVGGMGAVFLWTRRNRRP
jgi:rhombotail lipoprotein